jgi:hypothetical protein
MRGIHWFLVVVLAAAAGIAVAGPGATTTAGPDWAMNATVIEACSCPMFCPCYFNTKPAAHHEHGGGEKHFCRANLAYKINKGHHGTTSLDGAKFWIASDLGGDFSQGQMDWAVLTFDKALSKAQRDGVVAIAGQLFPVKWNSFTTAEGAIDTWTFDKDGAVALLDGGKTGEVRLKRFQGMTNEPVVIRNLRYWGAPRNDGFVLMPSQMEAYRIGPNAFEFNGTNGFMITVDIASKDIAPKDVK